MLGDVGAPELILPLGGEVSFDEILVRDPVLCRCEGSGVA
jgi:hypothetical protein